MKIEKKEEILRHAKEFGLNAEGNGKLFRVIVFRSVNFEYYLIYSAEKD